MCSHEPLTSQVLVIEVEQDSVAALIFRSNLLIGEIAPGRNRISVNAEGHDDDV